MDESEYWLVLEDMALDEEAAIDLRQFGRDWLHHDIGAQLRDAVAHRPLPIEEMMTPDEARVLEALPEALTVYRGCWEWNADGPCWSLRRRTAATFWGGQVDTLITGRVEKSQVVALKLERGEYEIISLDVTEISREPII